MDSDERLYTRVRDGDLAAFDELYGRYESPLFGFLLSFLRNRADAEDALHEVFLRALKTPMSRVETGGFRAWIFRIARNDAMNRHRAASRATSARALIDPEPPEASAHESLEARELHRALENAVTRLPPPLLEVYQLRTSGLSYEEIATVLEAPIGTVKSRMHEMVRLLREDVKPWTVRG